MFPIDEWKERGDFLSYRGRRIFYLDEGTGPVLVLIHGFPTSSWDWCRLWQPLTERYRCIAFDMIGFGFSDKPPHHPYSLFDQCDLHEVLLDKLGITQAHVLSHDYGDTVAQEWLARQAEGTERVALLSVAMLNGGIIYGKHHPRIMQRVLASPLGRIVGPLTTRRRFERSFRPIFGAGTQPDAEELAAYWHGIEHNRGTRVLHRIIRYLSERKRHAHRWVPVLAAPPVPLVFIVGEEDPISGRDMADAFVALGPAQHCVRLPGIGHYPQMEAPEQVIAAYAAFRDSLTAR